jgi:hypothetical protein
MSQVFSSRPIGGQVQGCVHAHSIIVYYNYYIRVCDWYVYTFSFVSCRVLFSRCTCLLMVRQTAAQIYAKFLDQLDMYINLPNFYCESTFSLIRILHMFLHIHSLYIF